VFDAGAYGGEALVETLKTGDKRLISYAVDLGTRITTQFDSRGDLVREIHLRRGVLTTRTAVVETRTYTIRNVDQKAKTLIIEHPARPGYQLLERKPTETTASAYRFEVRLAPSATEKFPVMEERVYDNTFSITSLTPDVLTTYIQNKALSDAARKQLEQIASLKSQIAATDADLRRTESDINALTRDQERMRQNIASLNQVAGQQQQVQSYAKQLADQESRLAAFRDSTAELQRKRAALDSQLSAAIEKVEF
jgi:murein L,D-transpeptidase YcbB/YkuD